MTTLIELFQCPQCKWNELVPSDSRSEICCEKCGSVYPIVNGCPILIHDDNSLFDVSDYLDVKADTDEPGIKFRNLIPKPSLNLAHNKVLTEFRDKLLKQSSSIVILVVGGGSQKGWLDERLGVNRGDSSNIQTIYTDIDINSNIDVFCDGHYLPFKNGVIDAIITTAVLEHVLYPERVADEISRVLKSGGLLYSELPFMQQVHEGAYDFTRYTLSGHRRLFNKFSEIDSGMVAGPGTALVWAIENFALAFFTHSILRAIVKAVVRIAFFWIKYFDYMLVNRPEAMDGASCTYFLGYKINGSVPDKQIIKSYVGAKHLNHT